MTLVVINTQPGHQSNKDLSLGLFSCEGSRAVNKSRSCTENTSELTLVTPGHSLRPAEGLCSPALHEPFRILNNAEEGTARGQGWGQGDHPEAERKKQARGQREARLLCVWR